MMRKHKRIIVFLIHQFIIQVDCEYTFILSSLSLFFELVLIEKKFKRKIIIKKENNQIQVMFQ